MFRFWYRYVFSNRSLVETGGRAAIWKNKIEPTYNEYMGLAFEKICQDYLLTKNVMGELPLLFTSIGRWWGTDPASHSQVEIDLVANDGKEYLICECKWRNEKLDLSVLNKLREKADIFTKKREKTWFILFSKSGFTDAVHDESVNNSDVILVDLNDIMQLADSQNPDMY